MKKFLTIIFTFAVLGCGGSSLTTLPEIEFEVPGKAINSKSIEVKAVSSNSKNVLSRWSYRVDRIVNHVNNILTNLDSKVTNNSNFSFTRSVGVISGYVADLTSDEEYTHQAVVCIDDVPFHIIKWNDENNKVLSVFDHSINPWTFESSTGLISKIVYTATATIKTLDVNVYGEPWLIPVDVSSAGNTHLGEHISMTIDSDDTFTMKGVNAWETSARNDVNKNDPFEGDVYATGKLISTGAGSFVVNRPFSELACSGVEFDQDIYDNPGWCILGEVATDGEVTYTSGPTKVTTITDEHWTDVTLKPIGISDEEKIEYIDDFESVTCTMP